MTTTLQNLTVTQPKALKLTENFFKNSGLFMTLTPETRMHVINACKAGIVTPITGFLEFTMLTSSPAYQEIKQCGKLKILDVNGLATITLTKSECKRFGIVPIVDRKKSTAEDAVGSYPHQTTPEEQEYYQEALYVLHCYNEARERLVIRSGKTFMPPPVVYTTSNKKACIEIVKRCAEWHVDNARNFVFAIFNAYHWNATPPLNYMYRPEAYDQWLANKDAAIDEIKAADAYLLTKGKTRVRKSAYRDLFNDVEKTKAAFAKEGKEDVCMEQIKDMLGYHPKSAICQECRLQTQCKQRLIDITKVLSKGALDILDVRTGKQDLLDVEERLMKLGVNISLYTTQYE